MSRKRPSLFHGEGTSRKAACDRRGVYFPCSGELDDRKPLYFARLKLIVPFSFATGRRVG